MKIQIFGLFVMLFSLILSQEAIAQIVIVEDGYAVIDCSGMPENAVKSSQELANSKQNQSDGGRVFRHMQNHGNQEGSKILGEYGTDVLYVNQKVSRKFAVASDYLSPDKLSWAEASGYNIAANSENTGESATAETGCAIYAGKSGGEAGYWRLPTQREYMIIYSHHEQLEKTPTFTQFKGGIHWSATEREMDNELNLFPSAWYVDFSVGWVLKAAKKNTNYVRCIKDL